jgi:hypothetical protein
MSVLKPIITSVVLGNVIVAVTDPDEVGTLYNELLVYKAPSVNGPFTVYDTIALTGASSYTAISDLTATASTYYRAQFSHNVSFEVSVFSDTAQGTGNFSEYSVPETTATYPPEIAVSSQDREIIESIRVTLGDIGLIERDYYDSSDSASRYSCSAQISADSLTWELREFKGWPQRVKLNGTEKTTLADPQVLGYRYLTFSGGISTITGTLDVYYNSFRFSNREILLAYDRANNLLVSCGLDETQITTEMLIMQAAILLLEGELREAQQKSVMIRDGDTTYDNSRTIMARTGDLNDLKQKIRELIDCARYNTSYGLTGVRID